MAAEVHKVVIWEVQDFLLLLLEYVLLWRGLMFDLGASVFVISWNVSSDGRCVFGVAQ